MDLEQFESFQKIPRLSREIVITEKIDGTNAQVCITKTPVGDTDVNCWTLKAGSRSRWITPEDDNHGFAKWAFKHMEELFQLGEGRHYGEWWGNGIQRGYGLTKGEKRFSLFNTSRWKDDAVRPKCCHVVPELYRGPFILEAVDFWIDRLQHDGSCAAPSFMKPEGIVIFHTGGNLLFKKTIEKDEEPKGKV